MLKFNASQILWQLEITFRMKSLKEVTCGSCPEIPTWHSYMRKDLGFGGCLFFHLYADSGGGSQWTAKACLPSASED